MDKRGLIIPLVWWNVGPEYWRESNKPIQVHIEEDMSLSFFFPFPTSKTSVGKSFKKIYVDCLIILFYFFWSLIS